jgi:hypothetical protein
MTIRQRWLNLCVLEGTIDRVAVWGLLEPGAAFFADTFIDVASKAFLA